MNTIGFNSAMIELNVMNINWGDFLSCRQWTDSCTSWNSESTVIHGLFTISTTCQKHVHQQSFPVSRVWTFSEFITRRERKLQMRLPPWRPRRFSTQILRGTSNAVSCYGMKLWGVFQTKNIWFLKCMFIRYLFNLHPKQWGTGCFKIWKNIDIFSLKSDQNVWGVALSQHHSGLVACIRGAKPGIVGQCHLLKLVWIGGGCFLHLFELFLDFLKQR